MTAFQAATKSSNVTQRAPGLIHPGSIGTWRSASSSSPLSCNKFTSAFCAARPKTNGLPTSVIALPVWVAKAWSLPASGPDHLICTSTISFPVASVGERVPAMPAHRQALSTPPREREKRPFGRRCKAPGHRRAPHVVDRHHGATCSSPETLPRRPRVTKLMTPATMRRFQT